MEGSSHFRDLDDKAKAILRDVIASREVLSQSLQQQEETSLQHHIESRESVQSQHIATRSQIIVAVTSAAATTDCQFQLMREEIENMSNTVARNQQDISRVLEEVNGLAQALARAQTDKQRKKIQDRRSLANDTLFALITAYQTVTALLENLKVQAAALMASIGFARLWKSQEEDNLAFSFQRDDSSTSIGTRIRQENSEVRQRRTAVLCSNYYYYYFPLCRRRHIVKKQRIMADLNAIHPVDADTQAQFPNLPLLLSLTQADWQPNFSWAVKGGVELPFLFNLPTPSVAYDFLSMAIAFAAVMPQVTDEIQAEDILADLFGNSTYLSSPPGSAQRQRIKNDYRDWKKIAGLLWLDELFITCHEECCTFWQAELSEVRLRKSNPNPESDPLLIQFWLWLMGGWKTCFSFEVPFNPNTESLKNSTKKMADSDFILVYTVAQFLVRASYHIDLNIEQDTRNQNTVVKISFLGAQASLSAPPAAVIQERRASPMPDI